ncbi:MAG: hypothetical protein WCT12_09210 [Verrucomicrobiota bacterium]
MSKSPAIGEAMSHLRKPYDFEFDFNSSSRIDCTEALSALPATINFIERHFYFFRLQRPAITGYLLL